jgi:hypothetical protein
MELRFVGMGSTDTMKFWVQAFFEDSKEYPIMKKFKRQENFGNGRLAPCARW